ncbi:hypothetical protein [Parapedobacter tibetensis]|nr:hypothetical protein [Parapedobacter tibetensis]
MPSIEVAKKLARGVTLDESDREHVFALIGAFLAKSKMQAILK